VKTCLFTTIFKNDPVEIVVAEAARIGYDAVELRAISHLPVDTPIERVHEIGRMIHGHGLQVAGIYAAGGRYSQLSDLECQQQIENLKRFVEMAVVLGADFVMDLPGGPSPKEATEEHWQRAALWMARAADVAAPADIKIAVEIHFGGLPETGDDALRLLEMIDRDNVGLIYDAGNLYLTPAPYGPDVIRKLGDRICHFHVKDESWHDNEDDVSQPVELHGRVFWHRLLSEGEVDHEPLFRTLEEIGYEGYLSVECHVTDYTPTFIAEHEYEAMQEVLARIGG